MQIDSNYCVNCRRCLDSCKIKYPITFNADNAIMDSNKCVYCGKCLDVNCKALSLNFSDINLDDYSPNDYAWIIHPAFKYHNAYKGYISNLNNLKFQVYDGGIGGDIALYLIRNLCQQNISNNYIGQHCQSSVNFLQKYVSNREYVYSEIPDIISLAIKYYKQVFNDNRKFIAIVPCASFYFSDAYDIVLFKNIKEPQQYIRNVNLLGDSCLGDYISITGDYALGLRLLEVNYNCNTTFNVFEDFSSYNNLEIKPDVWIPKQHAYCLGGADMFKAQKAFDKMLGNIVPKTLKAYYGRFKQVFLIDYSDSSKAFAVNVKDRVSVNKSLLHFLISDKTKDFINCNQCGYGGCSNFLNTGLCKQLDTPEVCPVLLKKLLEDKITLQENINKFLLLQNVHNTYIVQQIQEQLDFLNQEDIDFLENTRILEILVKILELSFDLKSADTLENFTEN